MKIFVIQRPSRKETKQLYHMPPTFFLFSTSICKLSTVITTCKSRKGISFHIYVSECSVFPPVVTFKNIINHKHHMRSYPFDLWKQKTLRLSEASGELCNQVILTIHFCSWRKMVPNGIKRTPYLIHCVLVDSLSSSMYKDTSSDLK